MIIEAGFINNKVLNLSLNFVEDFHFNGILKI